MKTIAEASSEMLAIKDFLSDAPDGAIIPYSDIENKSGVKMDSRGKQYMRSALHSLGREYACVRGYGVELSSADNSDVLVGSRLIKIDRAVKRGERTTSRVIAKHLEDMPQKTREKVLLAGSIFGAIRVSADLARKQFSGKKAIKIGN